MKQPDEAVRVALWILNEVSGSITEHKVSVRLWDGTLWPDAMPRRTTIVLKHAGAIRGIFKPPIAVSMGEAYLRDDFDVEGDWEDVGELFEALDVSSLSLRQKLSAGTKLLRLPRSAATAPAAAPGATARPAPLAGARPAGGGVSLRRVKRLLRPVARPAHGLFVRLLRDARRGPRHRAGAEARPHLPQAAAAARRAPAGHRLRLGRRSSCHAARALRRRRDRHHASASRRSSSRNERIAAAGPGRARAACGLQDYRDLDEPEGYDKIVSVGMFEHVGAGLLPDYFQQAYASARPGGVFLNHGIALDCDAPAAARGPNVHRPCTSSPTANRADQRRRCAPPRQSQASRCATWRACASTTPDAAPLGAPARSESRASAARSSDEPTYRIWRLYMAGSAYGFATRRSTCTRRYWSRTTRVGVTNCR